MRLFEFADKSRNRANPVASSEEKQEEKYIIYNDDENANDKNGLMLEQESLFEVRQSGFSKAKANNTYNDTDKEINFNEEFAENIRFSVKFDKKAKAAELEKDKEKEYNDLYYWTNTTINPENMEFLKDI